jgi:hypothetical protein
MPHVPVGVGFLFVCDLREDSPGKVPLETL